jgi:hypothetical protein
VTVRDCVKALCCNLAQGKEDLVKCAQISCPMRSRILWLCACRGLTEDNKEKKSWWT